MQRQHFLHARLLTMCLSSRRFFTPLNGSRMHSTPYQVPGALRSLFPGLVSTPSGPKGFVGRLPFTETSTKRHAELQSQNPRLSQKTPSVLRLRKVQLNCSDLF